jgi:sugar lactone lactonase YvrE
MICRKFPSVFTPSFTLAALLTLASGIAQTQTATDENAALHQSAPTATTFHFSDGGNDIPGRLTTDAAGNFYVSTAINSTTQVSGFAVLKYNFNGKLQGAFRYKPMPGESLGSAVAVKLDKQNNIYAVGATSLGGLVASFTSAGTQRWADRFDQEPIALAIDPSGNIYVAGNGNSGGSDGVGPVLDWLIVKYSSTGKVLWEQRHTGTPGEDSKVRDIQLDPSGNPIVLGTTSNNPAILTNTLTLAKLDPQGALLWAKDFSVPHSSQVPGGVVIDRGGNVYATSTTNPPEGIATPLTVKYDPNGALQFVLQGNGAGGSSVAIDPTGDVLLTGATTGFGRPNFISATKINPAGRAVWVTQIPSTGKIVSDSAGNSFVAGFDFTITKLDSSGKILFSSSILPGDSVTDAVVDPFNNLLVTGFGQNAQFSDDIFTLRLK